MNSDEYIFSRKYTEIRSESLVLEYIGKNIFIDDNGRKYIYENDILYILDEITGEKGLPIS